MRLKSFPIFLIAIFQSLMETKAWLSNYGFRELIQAVHGNINATTVDIREPLKIPLTDTEILKQLLERLSKQHGEETLRDRTSNQTLSDREGDETTKADGGSTEASTTVRFDDPNFIPGEYLDASGEAKFVTPQPVADVLIQFMAEVDSRQETLWQVGVYILLDLLTEAIFLVLAAWVIGLFIPMHSLTTEIAKTMPMEKEDRLDKMRELAQMYEENPIRFAHLPGFEIPGFDPLESSSDESEPDPHKRKARMRSTASSFASSPSSSSSSSAKRSPADSDDSADSRGKGKRKSKRRH